MPDVTVNEVMSAVDKLSKSIEGFAGIDPTTLKALAAAGVSGESISDIKKSLEVIDAREKKNQEVFAELQKKQAAYEEIQEKVTALELKLSQGTGSKANLDLARIETVKEEMKFLNYYIRTGGLDHPDLKSEKVNPMVQVGTDRFGAPIMDRKYLRTDMNQDGGFMIQGPEFLNDIIKDLNERSSLRRVARVRSTNRKELTYIKRATLVSSYKVGEGETFQESQSSYERGTVHVHKHGVRVAVSTEMLEDSDFNIEDEIRSDVMERMALDESAEFITGTGFKEAYGITTDAVLRANALATGDASNVSWDDIIRLAGSLKTGYRGTFLFNRATRVNLLLKKDLNGNYLWQAGDLNRGLGDTIMGYPYLETPEMPDIAANAYPIAFGDFRQGYLIVDRTSLEVIRDRSTQVEEGKVVYHFQRRYGGDILKHEAIKLLHVAVS